MTLLFLFLALFAGGALRADESPEQLYESAKSAWNQSKWSEAAAGVEKVEGLVPANWRQRAVYLRGVALLRAGDFAAAAPHWRKIAESWPPSTEAAALARYHQALALFYSQNGQGAFDALQRIPQNIVYKKFPNFEEQVFSLAAFIAYRLDRKPFAVVLAARGKKWITENLMKKLAAALPPQSNDMAALVPLLERHTKQRFRARILALETSIPAFAPAVVDGDFDLPELPKEPPGPFALTIGVGVSALGFSQSQVPRQNILSLAGELDLSYEAARDWYFGAASSSFIWPISKTSTQNVWYFDVEPVVRHRIHVTEATALQLGLGYVYSTVFGSQAAQFGFTDIGGPQASIALLHGFSGGRRGELHVHYGVRSSDTSILSWSNGEFGVRGAFWYEGALFGGDAGIVLEYRNLFLTFQNATINANFFNAFLEVGF